MVPIGKIEEVAKREIRQRKRENDYSRMREEQEAYRHYGGDKMHRSYQRDDWADDNRRSTSRQRSSNKWKHDKYHEMNAHTQNSWAQNESSYSQRQQRRGDSKRGLEKWQNFSEPSFTD